MKIQSTLPPTAAPIPLGGLAAGLIALLGGNSHNKRLKAELREEFDVQHVFLLSSGKAALTLILLGLRRLSAKRKVVIPAYTCFSVPSAVVKAGLEVVPCDVNPHTLDFDEGQLEQALDDQTLCVLPTHLFGLPADVDAVRMLSKSRGITVVEDAAQAMGGVSRGRRLGTVGDVGFFSLGRGKNISCGGGGVVVTNSTHIGAALQIEYDKLPSESRWSAAKNLAELVATGMLIHPRLYWLPSGLPFLGLGETRFYADFPIERMAGARAATLIGWQQRLRTANALRRQQAHEFTSDLNSTVPDVKSYAAVDASYVRLPILVRDRSVKEALGDRAAALGLGISGCYPTTIQQIPELRGRLPAREYRGAAEIVERLVTLPTHQFVRTEDRRRICQIIGEVSASPSRSVSESAGPTRPSTAVRAASRT